MPARVQNHIADLDNGPYADPEKLIDEAFFLPSLNGRPEDRDVFDSLVEELDFKSCWLNTGMKFSRDICLGDMEVVQRSPTYLALVNRMAEFFDVRPVRTLVNLYKDGTDWCNFHSDQYKQGGYPIDLTVGASFGDERRLVWREKRNHGHVIEIPQRNGDVFAFSDHINANWQHMVPREDMAGPRISVIVWCCRYKDETRAPEQLGSFPHMLYHNPKQAGRDWLARPERDGSRGRRGRDGQGRREQRERSRRRQEYEGWDAARGGGDYRYEEERYQDDRRYDRDDWYQEDRRYGGDRYEEDRYGGERRYGGRRDRGGYPREPRDFRGSGGRGYRDRDFRDGDPFRRW